MWVDAKSGAVNPRFVQLRSGLTQQQAKAEAAIHWDRCELARIGKWNCELALYWARNRLLRYLQSQPAAAGEHQINEADRVRPTFDKIPLDERFDELIHVRTCGSVLADTAEVSAEVRRIMATRGSGAFLL
jgi:hypothetical protein